MKYHARVKKSPSPSKKKNGQHWPSAEARLFFLGDPATKATHTTIIVTTTTITSIL